MPLVEMRLRWDRKPFETSLELVRVSVYELVRSVPRSLSVNPRILKLYGGSRFWLIALNKREGYDDTTTNIKSSPLRHDSDNDLSDTPASSTISYLSSFPKPSIPLQHTPALDSDSGHSDVSRQLHGAGSMVQGRIFHRDTLLLPSLLLILNGGSPFAGIVAMVKKLMSGTILWADVSSSISKLC